MLKPVNHYQLHTSLLRILTQELLPTDGAFEIAAPSLLFIARFVGYESVELHKEQKTGY